MANHSGGRCFGTAAAAITDQIGPFPTFVIAEQHSYRIMENEEIRRALDRH
jgi:hypothetical protein